MSLLRPGVIKKHKPNPTLTETRQHYLTKQLGTRRISSVHDEQIHCKPLVVFTGSHVQLVGSTKLPFGQVPLMLYNGEVTLQTASGKIVPLVLETHVVMEERQISEMHLEDQNIALDKALKLNRYSTPLSYAE